MVNNWTESSPKSFERMSSDKLKVHIATATPAAMIKKELVGINILKRISIDYLRFIA